jgi:hypothetical protein
MSDTEGAVSPEDEQQYMFEPRVEWLESSTEHVDAPAVVMTDAVTDEEAWA